MDKGYRELRERVLQANRRIAAERLAALTWGNASEADRDAGVVAIKPSGLAYEDLTVEDIVAVSLRDATVLAGRLRPSSDLETHLVLYRAFPVGGIVHSHSPAACAWSQAGREIPCLGTTHADTFYGPVPVTRGLHREEVEGNYERQTGAVIVDCFAAQSLDPLAIPGVLVAGHGPFAWGADAGEAVAHAITLEEIALMARETLVINPAAETLPQYLVNKHYSRKHGKNAYYGQPGGSEPETED